jgi:putative NIF3 family GTP cyclohydrolase 1 type 2
VILAWHRETEVFWPKLLSEHLKRKFGLKIVFLDEKY